MANSEAGVAPSIRSQAAGAKVHFALDPSKPLRFIDAKIAKERDDRRRNNLQTVRDHIYHEITLNPDGVMATLSPKANYRVWVDGVDKGPKGYKGIRDWYVDQNIRRQKTFVIQLDLERVIVDDEFVVTEGQMNVVVDGAHANKVYNRGYAPEDVYLQSFRQIVVWSMDEQSKLLGEDFYSSGMAQDDAWRRLEPDEIPADWYRLVELSKTI